MTAGYADRSASRLPAGLGSGVRKPGWCQRPLPEKAPLGSSSMPNPPLDLRFVLTLLP